MNAENEVASPKGSPGQFGKLDYLKITVLGFALTSLWSSLHTIILPLRLLDFVPESQKNTYLDMLILTGLLLAFFVQPIAGALSDSFKSSWGRRRPFILVGTVAVIIFTFGIGIYAGYAAVFVIYCAMQVASNVAQGPYQAFIPDLVPENKRGRAAGVRGFLLILGGVLLVRVTAIFMTHYPADKSGLWLSLVVLVILVAIALIFTLFSIREQPWPGKSVSPRNAVLNSFKVDLRARPQFIPFLIASFLIFIAWNTLMAHALYYFKDMTGVASPAAATGDLVLTMGAAMLVVVFFAGWLSDKIGHRSVAIGAGFMGAIGTVALFFSTGYWQILLSGVLLGMCAGAWLSSQWALATDLVGKTEAGKYIGIVNMAVAGAGAASRLIGPLIDTLNHHSFGLGYQVMLLACFVYFITGSILLIRVKIRPDISPNPAI